ncbi:MAG: 50S ribosomal protein L11 methyltransferase [Saprospiraceae bacterium]|nr:50S ribosomal protein L11 methyltransferase [Saprospiraceae bacterium]
MANAYVLLEIPGGNDIVMARLSEMGFEAFEENDENITAYLPALLYNPEFQSEVNLLLAEAGFHGQWSNMEARNWNEVWESNFSPVEVTNVCRVRANFHEGDPTYPYEIVIQPKMAFGTGHHQTTYMMIKLMAGIEFKDQKVFDFGCGTGILAIFASMQGALSVVANDIENESYINTLENAEVNQIGNIIAKEGGLEVIEDQLFDIILANINRNVLLASAQRLASLSRPGGILLLSGILETDYDVITETFINAGFNLNKKEQKDAWLCLEWHKTL